MKDAVHISHGPAWPFVAPLGYRRVTVSHPMQLSGYFFLGYTVGFDLSASVASDFNVLSGPYDASDFV